MSNQAMIDHIEECFSDMYLKAIPVLFKPELAYISFAAIFTGIEGLAKMYSDESDPGPRFKAFFSEYFKDWQSGYFMDGLSRSKAFWQLRCSLIHEFNPHEGFDLICDGANLHLKKGGDGKTQVDAESFFNEFKNAAGSYFQALRSGDPDLNTKFNKVHANRIINTNNRPTAKFVGLSQIARTNSIETNNLGS